MGISPTKIVIIHDDLSEDDPIIEELSELYGKDNVFFTKESQKGLDYVLDHLSQKIIVILDLNFKTGEIGGTEVFEKIRNQTSLVFIIIWTTKTLGIEIKLEELITFINHKATAFVNTLDFTPVLEWVEKAIHQMDIRVDSAIEQWINAQPIEEKDKPYLVSGEGETYTMNQVAEEIRQQTDFGKKIEKNILMLAVDLLMRGKERLK